MPIFDDGFSGNACENSTIDSLDDLFSLQSTESYRLPYRLSASSSHLPNLYAEMGGGMAR